MELHKLFDLSGQVALITGGSRGLGEEIATGLGEAGASLMLLARREPGLTETVERLRGQGFACDGTVCDASDAGAVRAAVEKTIERFGRIDTLVNNAGISWGAAAEEMPVEKWRAVIDVNLTGAFLCAREAARMMRDERSRGSIVNISSVHERIAWEGFSHYCASKGGLMMFMQSIAKELAPLGIRVLSVAPGAIDTPINKSVLEHPEQSAKVLAEIPIGRWGHVDDVARAVAWLASEQADYVTGATLFVDGGMTLYPRFV
jgi:glucose 1-dehydrogenase